MNKLRWLFAAATILLCTTPTRTDGPSMVTGGGTGTFYADLDDDGDIDGAHFGFAVAQPDWRNPLRRRSVSYIHPPAPVPM